MARTAPQEVSRSTTRDDEMKYRGVRRRKWGKYVSEIRLPNSRERIWLGSYDTAEKAARAFDAALFCLRGSSAKFNLPDDPPEIAGGESLSPAEIQVVAQQYSNSYGGGPNLSTQMGGRESLESNDATAPYTETVDLVDRSFWEMLDMNSGASHNAGCEMDFGLFPEPGEMYAQPSFETRVYEYEDDSYDHGNVHSSSLWNF